jgi:bifunctional non-homologous end joining protein LigD
MALEAYKAKRDFSRTKEPAESRKSAGLPHNFFVVQKHAASRLHYDLRLALDGVLKSWAVPKGFPAQKGEKRLAVQVEDHPLDYAQFEGTIPQGNYGAGTVMVWDQGEYHVSGGNPLEALQSGKLHLVFAGKKLNGEWTLVRMRGADKDAKENWLVLKSGDSVPPISPRADDRSILSGRTMKQIAAAHDAQWESNQPASPPQKNRPPPRSVPASPADFGPILESLPSPPPAFIIPMKALLSKTLPQGTDWIYEIKFDGYRGLAIKKKNQITLWSRNHKNLTANYPGIVRALESLPAREAVLDGEILAVDPDGLPSFQLLQSYLSGTDKPPLLYYAFDLLNLNSKDLTRKPLHERKDILEKLIAQMQDTVRFSGNIQADHPAVLDQMRNRGLEGVIAKKKNSRYQPGKRTGAWIKYKWSSEHKFVIGGYTPPAGHRGYFGALLVGVYQDQQLCFISKVGTGFSTSQLESLHAQFQSLIRKNCPFTNLPAPRSSRFAPGLSLSEMKKCTWLEPKLVCQVRYTEWTRDNHLRHPVFLGLRDDVEPREVKKETA